MHPSSMDLQALADDEPLAERESAIVAHVRSCDACQRVLSEMRAAHERDAACLLRLDRSIPSVDVDAVIARATAGRSVRGMRGAIAAGIGVAIIAGAAAAAVPGAPLHSLVERLVARATAFTSSHTPAAASTSAPSQILPDVGVSFPPGSRVEIVFTRAPASVRVRLTLVDAPMVRVTSRGGTAAYQLTAGGVTIDSVSSDASFEVVLPSTVGRAIVRVGGRTVFTKNGRRIDTSGAADSSGAYVLSLSPSR